MDFGFGNSGQGFRIAQSPKSLDFGSWPLGHGLCVFGVELWTLGFGFRILNVRLGTLGFGRWPLGFGLWMLIFGLGNSSQGFRKGLSALDFGLWIRGFVFSALDFGISIFGILGSAS